MMGYAQSSQTAAGLHIRLFARAFVIADPVTPASRIAFVSMVRRPLQPPGLAGLPP